MTICDRVLGNQRPLGRLRYRGHPERALANSPATLRLPLFPYAVDQFLLHFSEYVTAYELLTQQHRYAAHTVRDHLGNTPDPNIRTFFLHVSSSKRLLGKAGLKTSGEAVDKVFEIRTHRTSSISAISWRTGKMDGNFHPIEQFFLPWCNRRRR